MKKIRKPSRGIALVLAAALALTPLAGFPLPAFAAGEKAPQHAVTAATTPGDSSPDSNTQNTPPPPTSNDSETHDPGVNDPAAPALPKDENTVTDPAGDAPVASELPATDVLGEKEATPPTKALITPSILATPAAKAAGDLAISEDNFPDPVFRDYVKTLAGGSDTMTALHVAGITKIDVTYDDTGTAKKIADLTGIESFTNLKRLSCSGNALQELPIAAMTNLEWLFCDNNALKELPIAAMTNLKRLSCSGNALQELPIAAMTNLERLSCDNNALKELPIAAMTNLKQLSCSGNALQELPIAAMTNLERLSCDNNALKELPIAAMTNLKQLSCSGNALQELPIAAMTNLEWLFCDNNALKELSIANNTKLTFLTCNDNQLPALELTNNPLLTEVNCGGNLLDTLNLEKNTALTSLLCGFNNLDKLDVSKNTNLIQLGCQDNKLPALDVEVNTQLTSLFCQGNQLSSLILPTGNTLTTLVCHDNHLAILDLQDHQAVGTGASTVAPQTVAAELAQQTDGSYVLDMAAIVGQANIARVNTTMHINGENVAGAYDPTTGKATLATLPTTMDYFYKTEGSKTVKDMWVNMVPFRVAYTITSTADAVGGTITPAGETKVYKGGSQEYTFKANEGYELGKVTVDNVEVPASEIKAGSYTINNVQANTAIHAAFTKKIDPQPPITYHSVTASAGENGAIAPMGTRIVPQGSSLEYKFKAEEGYELDVVTVNGTAVKPVGGAYTLSNIQGATTIHATFKAIDPPVDPTDPVDPVDPPKPPVDPTDPVDPPKPPVDPADPINPPTPPAVPDNGGNNNGTTTIVERTNTVVVPAAPQAAAPTSPATPAAAEAKAAAPAKPAADTATPQGQPENSDLGAQAFDTQHSHIPLALLLLAVWLVGGFAVIRQRKHTHDAIERASY